MKVAKVIQIVLVCFFCLQSEIAYASEGFYLPPDMTDINIRLKARRRAERMSNIRQEAMRQGTTKGLREVQERIEELTVDMRDKMRELHPSMFETMPIEYEEPDYAYLVNATQDYDRVNKPGALEATFRSPPFIQSFVLGSVVGTIPTIPNMNLKDIGMGFILGLGGYAVGSVLGKVIELSSELLGISKEKSRDIGTYIPLTVGSAVLLMNLFVGIDYLITASVLGYVSGRVSDCIMISKLKKEREQLIQDDISRNNDIEWCKETFDSNYRLGCNVLHVDYDLKRVKAMEALGLEIDFKTRITHAVLSAGLQSIQNVEAKIMRGYVA